MWGSESGRSPREARKIFMKFIEIGHGKLINLITFSKISWNFWAYLVKNTRIIENSFLEWGSVAEPAFDGIELLGFYKIAPLPLYFLPNISRVAHQDPN